MLRRLTKGGCAWGDRSNGRRPRHFVSGFMPGAACACGRRVPMLHVVLLPQRWSSVMWKAVTSLIWRMRASPPSTVVSFTMTTTANMVDGPMPKPSCKPPCELTRMVPSLTAPRPLVLTLRMLVGGWTDLRLLPMLCCSTLADVLLSFMWLRRLARQKIAPFRCVSSMLQMPALCCVSIAHSPQAAPWLLPARGPGRTGVSWSVAVTALSRSGVDVWCSTILAARPRHEVEVCDRYRVCLCMHSWPQHVAYAFFSGSISFISLPSPVSLPLASWRVNLALRKPTQLVRRPWTMLLGGWLSLPTPTSVSGLWPGSSEWSAASPTMIMLPWPSGLHFVAIVTQPCGILPTAMFLSQRRRSTALNMRPAALPQSARRSISPVQRGWHQVPVTPLLMKTVALVQIPEPCRSGHSSFDLCRRLVDYKTRGPLWDTIASVLQHFPWLFYVHSWLSRPPPALGLRGRCLCVMLSVRCSWWVCLWFLSSLRVFCSHVTSSWYHAVGGGLLLISRMCATCALDSARRHVRCTAQAAHGMSSPAYLRIRQRLGGSRSHVYHGLGQYVVFLCLLFCRFPCTTAAPLPDSASGRPSAGGSNARQQIQKRSFRRARNRLLQHGFTMYRGRKYYAGELGAKGTAHPRLSPSRPVPRPEALLPSWPPSEAQAPATVRPADMITLNLGGLTKSGYDELAQWLETEVIRHNLDVVLLQEHWRPSSEFCLPHWTWIQSGAQGRNGSFQHQGVSCEHVDRH